MDLSLSSRRSRARANRPFLIGFSIGILYFAYTFAWLWSLHPLSTLGINNTAASFVLIFVGYAGSIIVSSLPWGIVGILIPRVFSKNIPLKSLTVAGLVTTSEFIRAWLFGLFLWGSGSVPGPYWPFGHIAYVLDGLPILPDTAAVWGIYGILFMLVWLVSLIFEFFEKKNIAAVSTAWGAQLSVLACAVLLAAVIQFPGTEGSSIPVAVLQTNRSSADQTPAERLADFQQQLQMLTDAARVAAEPMIIIFPEGAGFNSALTSFLTPSAVPEFYQKLSEHELLVVDSIKVRTETTISKSLVVSSRNGVVGSVDKQVLSPGGEFIPQVAKLINTVLRADSSRITPLVPGKSAAVQYQGFTFSIALCSEILSPHILRSQQPDAIFGSGNLALFHGNPQLDGQMRRAAAMRAREHQKYVVWASNAGTSYIINPEGDTVAQAPRLQSQILTGTIVPNTGRTWYTKAGDWPIFVLSFAISLWSFRKRTA